MSVQRSPPDSQLLQLPTNIEHYSSDPSLNTSSSNCTEDNYFNITKRHKRTFDEITDKTSTNILDIKTMFDNKFEMLNNTLLAIVSQNQEIKQSVETMSNKHEELLSKINILEQDNIMYKNRISTLENKIDILEKHSRYTSLEIRNLPKKKEENKEVLISLVNEISSTLGMENPIQQTEIKDIYRAKSDTIVVDFTTALRKESLISSYKLFNKTKRLCKEALLNSDHFNFPGPSRAVYISESLTSKTKHLFYLAREGIKNKKLVAAWTSYGKLYVKKEDDAIPIRINEESQLQNVIAK